MFLVMSNEDPSHIHA